MALPCETGRNAGSTRISITVYHDSLRNRSQSFLIKQKQSSWRNPQRRDDRERHERKGDEGIQFPRNSHFIGLILHLLQKMIDLVKSGVAHQPHNREGKGFKNLPVFHHRIPALDTDDLVHSPCHIRIAVSNDDDVMRVMGNRRGNGAVANAIAFGDGDTDFSGILMPLHCGNL